MSRIVGAVGVAVCLLVLVSACSTTATRPDRRPYRAPSAFRVGLTSTEFTADPWGDPGAVQRAQRLLHSFMVQNQFIYGWGVGNPEPAPGHYYWGDLDGRVHLLLSTHRRVVLTLCGAPTWMTGLSPHASDYVKQNTAPTPAHYEDFAALAARIAQRYPGVRYFQVWSEMRGFFDHSTGQWNYRGYTRMYNDVYRAIKAVRPNAQIGGPYIVSTFYAPGMPAVFQGAVSGSWGFVDKRVLDAIGYWLSHKAGAQFLAVDAELQVRTPNGEVPLAPDSAAAALAATDSWLEEQTGLPIWWSELRADAPPSIPPTSQAISAILSALRALRRSKASVALLWCPERCSDGSPGMWSSTARAGGGRPTLLYTSLSATGFLSRRHAHAHTGSSRGRTTR